MKEECMYGRSVGKARGIWLFAAENTVLAEFGKSVGFRL